MHTSSLSLSLGQSVKAYSRRVAAASYHLGCLFTRATYTLDVSRDVGQAELVLDDLSIDTRRPERRRPPLLLTLSAPNFFFFQTPCTYTRTHLLRVKVARVTRGCCAKRVGYRLFACGISICVGCSLVQNMDLCRIIGLRGIWICMKYEFM